MTTVNYKYCYLDTCVISEMLKDKSVFRNVVTRIAIDGNYKLSISLYTIFELMQTPELYNSFADIVVHLPAVIQKNHVLLLKDEMVHHPNENKESLIIFTPVGLKVADRVEGFKAIMLSPVIEAARLTWEQEKNEILKGMIDNVKNFEPNEVGKYTVKRIEQFADLATLQYLQNCDPNFVEVTTSRKIRGNIRMFRSVQMMMFIAFYKFYISKRKPRLSDVPDVVMASSFPYMNAVILEKDEAEMLRQIRKRHSIINALEVYTLQDFKVD